MKKFENILEIKSFFKKNRIQPFSNEEKEWGKLEEAFRSGISFFLEYARVHFLQTHYQTLLKDMREIGQSATQTSCPVSKDLINSIYLVAKESLKDKKFAPAHDLFYLLSVITPNNFDIWIGLGISCQSIQQEQEALQAFEQAKKLHPQSPIPDLYCAEIYNKLRREAL